MTTILPYVDEPTDVLRDLNAPEALVKYPSIRTTPREAAIRQGTALAQPVYAVWKAQLRPAGVSWQAFVSASSDNRDAFRDWADGKLAWPSMLEGLAQQLSGRASSSFALAES